MVSYQYLERLNELDEQLVKEMRLLQKLLALSKQEQDSLFKGANEQIMPVVEEKEALIDQIVLLEEDKQVTMNKLAREINLSPMPRSLDELLLAIGSEEVQHLRKLAEGIVALAGRIREVNEGSHALANENLKAAFTIQAFLLKLNTSEDNYMPKKPVYSPFSNPTLNQGAD